MALPVAPQRPATGGKLSHVILGAVVLVLGYLVAHEFMRWTGLGALLTEATTPVKWTRVGDQDQWMTLVHDDFIMGSEPLGRWMQHWAWLLTGSREWALRLPSLLAGLIHVAGAAWLLRDLAPTTRWPTLLFLSLAPYAIFFIGYPSTCPLAYAFVGVYLVAGVRYLRLQPERAPWSESALLALACWSHGMALWAAGAQLVLVFAWASRRPMWPPSRAAAWRLAALCAIPFLPLGLTLLYAYNFGTGLPGRRWMGNATGSVFGAFVSLSGSDLNIDPFTQFGLWSRGHVLGLGGVVLRLSPGLLLVPWVLRWTREVAFVGSALIGLLGLAVAWNFDLGFLRDEKFVLFAVPVQVMLSLWLIDRPRLWWLAVGSAGAMLALLLPQIAW